MWVRRRTHRKYSRESRRLASSQRRDYFGFRFRRYHGCAIHKRCCSGRLAALCASPIILFNGLRQIKALYANYSTPLHLKQWPSMCGESRDKWQMLPAWTNAIYPQGWLSILRGSPRPGGWQALCHLWPPDRTSSQRFDFSRRSTDRRGPRAY